MAKTLKNEAGISIVEILLTVIIIAITTLIIFSFSRNSLKMTQYARANDTAYLAAEQKIADLATEVFPASALPVTGSDNITLENISYTRTWTVEQSGYVTLARVTVDWNAMNGARQITLAGAVN